MKNSQKQILRLKNMFMSEKNNTTKDIIIAEREIMNVISEYFEINKKNIDVDVIRNGNRYDLKISAKAQSIKPIGRII